jgi:hypothetical protein
MQISANDLELFYNLLTPRIKADLSSWYGSKACLVGEPTFHPRPWSYFFRYRIRLNNFRESAILAKIRHIENMRISEAVLDKKMREEMKDEFEALVKLRGIFLDADNTERYATIRPLAFYKDLNVLVMEEADIRTLKSCFQKPGMWREGKARRMFKTYLELTGGWLRTFHDRIGEVSEGAYFSEGLYQKVQLDLEGIQVTSGKDMTSFHFLLESLYRRYQGKTLPFRITHDNFSLANVFVTGDEKICSFDPHNKPGAIYLDIAKLFMDMETCFVQLATYGLSVPLSRLEKFNAAFLHGYFRSEPVDDSALNLYCLLLLIEKWNETEMKIAEATGVRKTAYAVSAHLMRSYYLRLIRRRLRKNEQ